jgi:hypothetical protein
MLKTGLTRLKCNFNFNPLRFGHTFTATKNSQKYETIAVCINIRPFCCPVEPFDRHVAMAHILPKNVSMLINLYPAKF